jgi:hypothetical protein
MPLRHVAGMIEGTEPVSNIPHILMYYNKHNGYVGVPSDIVRSYKIIRKDAEVTNLNKVSPLYCTMEGTMFIPQHQMQGIINSEK